MKTLEEYLIEKAVLIKGADSFPLNLTRDAHRGTKARILEAMKAAITEACREQREICAKAAKIKNVGPSPCIIGESIIHAPEPTLS